MYDPENDPAVTLARKRRQEAIEKAGILAGLMARADPNGYVREQHQESSEFVEGLARQVFSDDVIKP